MIPFPQDVPGDEPYGAFAENVGAAVPDNRLAVRAALCLIAVLRDCRYEITVHVQNGVVMLDGLVASDDVRGLAHRVTWATPGVRDVSNRLAVGATLPQD